jgi:hypothetical protein
VTRAILDDHLLRDLLAGNVPTELEGILEEHEPATTNHYLYRLCRNVVSASGGSTEADDTLHGRGGHHRQRDDEPLDS